MVRRKKIHKKLILIAYDIQDDKRRAKCAELLETYGVRVNFSVFECMLSDAQYTKVMQKLELLIHPKYDKIVCYPICLQCISKSLQLPDKRLQYSTNEII